MANEAVLVFKRQEPVPFTVHNSNGIEKGSILILSGAMTAALNPSGSTIVPIAGISASEKIASDGKTRLAVHTLGSGNIFKVGVSGSGSFGDRLVISSGQHNWVASEGLTAVSGSKVVGTAMETWTTGQTILMRQ